MFDFQSKFKRQIEILGLCLSEETQKPIITFDIAEIDYNKMGSKIEKDKIIEPLLIFQNEGNWRLLAGSNELMKQYLIDKIVKVKSAGKRFEKSEYKFSDLFKYSWKSWLGDEKHKIKLWLSTFWTDRVKPRMLVEDQKITKNEDGSIIFECTVNSLSEIAGWIVSRGTGVKVLEPKELKRVVIELAEGILTNY